MNRSLRTGFNGTLSAIAVALICAVFTFTAIAQTGTGKPLDAKTLAALVAELKGVVARTATEPGESDMVAKKWDARRDLAGKTKLAVINLLFQDVKSAVQDAGTQYTISSIFGMYKIMPDDAIKPETPAAADPAKPSSEEQAGPDKPLDARTLAALVQELKGVVARTATEPGESDVVARKWDARRDLAGKTKREVITLLFQDVRSSVADAGTQYTISSMFGMYKLMPDDAITDTGSVGKAPLINKLVNITLPMHPSAGPARGYVYDVFLGTEDDEAVRRETARKIRFEGFDLALGKNETLTAAQKAFVQQNYDQILTITTKITADARAKNLPMDRWLKEGLQESYEGSFTAAELRQLIDFFSGKNGEDVLKFNNMISTDPGAGPPKGAAAKALESKYREFIETELGWNWKIAYSDEAESDRDLKKDAAMEADPDADGFEIYRPENLNKLFNKFVADNFKK